MRRDRVKEAGLVAAVAVIFVMFAPLAEAAAPEFVLRMPEAGGVPGEGAGQLDNPRAIAADPDTGHVFITDRRNARVSEYTAWGLFVKAWGWGVADGSEQLQTCGPPEPDEDPDPTLCRKGLPGDGDGQMALLAGGIAVDSEGNVWVGDMENDRIQKFAPDGSFLLTIGGDVNKTKVEGGAPAAQRNLCPIDPTDVCQKGTPGEAPGQFSASGDDVIAYSPAGGGAILVGDKDRIQFFALSGGYLKEVPFEGPLAAFTGQTVNALDVDKDGNAYFSVSNLEDIYKISSTGTPLAPGKPGESSFEVGNPLAVTVDVAGGVYAIDDPPGIAPHLEARVVKFDATGAKLVPTKAEEEEARFFPYVPPLGPLLTGLTTNVCAGSESPGNLYIASFRFAEVSEVNAYGTAPVGCEEPPERDPEVLVQFASSVGGAEATVKAQINPRFWSDTTYYVEYGTSRCSEGGCGAKQPIPSALLTERSVNAPITTVGILLEGLEPGTTYHYRFVAESSGGGPVFGIDPDGRQGPAEASPEEGLEATFTTFPPAGEQSICANEAARSGSAGNLPDCRAYEMVSPLDKGGGDVALWQGRNALAPQLFEVHQSDRSGQRFTYTSAFAFADPEGAPYVSQYLASRGQGGWSTDGISPPRTEAPVDATTLFGNEFQGFSEDLCQAWIRHFSVSTLAEKAIEKYPNLYRRANCAGTPEYEALTTEKPAKRLPKKYVELRVQGFSADGSHSIFVANDSLLPVVPALKGEFDLRLYEHTGGELRFVCYLPNGKPSSNPCAAGTPAGTGGANASIVHNAVSSDGSRIFWSTYEGAPGIGNEPAAPGQIFVRIDGDETRKVSTTKSLDPAFYWTASDDGSKAIFELAAGTLKDQLYELDVDTGTPTLIAKGVEGPMGASEDASRIYFASTEDLDAGGPASTGDHNLYLYEADLDGGPGDFTLVMELATTDIGGTTAEPAPIDEVPFQRSARVSADGLHATFVSSVSPTPTGYDNHDSSSGEPAQEVYLYDAAEGELHCVSCNRTGARPSGENIGTDAAPFWATARIQGWETLLHAPRVLSEDGTRVFFESFEALEPSDVNGTWDVYQWEEPGNGSCTTASDSYSAVPGGCVDLISAGTDRAKSTFLDADPSGDNVFFSTQSTLVEADYGLNDVYVARVGGGFLEPAPPVPCEGAACQVPPPPPPDVTPPTETSSGAGNVVVKPKPRRCPKGKRKVRRAGKVKCIKRKRKAAHRRRAKR